MSQRRLPLRQVTGDLQALLPFEVEKQTALLAALNALRNQSSPYTSPMGTLNITGVGTMSMTTGFQRSRCSRMCKAFCHKRLRSQLATMQMLESPAASTLQYHPD